jgi:hypothetical protein
VFKVFGKASDGDPETLAAAVLDIEAIPSAYIDPGR